MVGGQYIQWLLQDAFGALVLGGIVLGIVLIGLVVRGLGWAVEKARPHKEDGPAPPAR